MSEKLLAILTPISEFLQKGAAMIKVFDPFWVILVVVAVVLVIAIITLDKPKAISMLLIVYTIGFVLTLIPSVMRWLGRVLDAREQKYALIALGLLPVITLIVHKKKKRR